MAKRFGFGFYQDMGDVETVTGVEDSGQSAFLSAMGTVNADGRPVATQESSLMAAGSAGIFGGSSAAASAVVEDKPSNWGANVADAFGGLANAFAKVGPSIAKVVPSEYRPIFGAQPLRVQKPVEKPMSTEMKIIFGGIAIGGLYLLVKSTSGGKGSGTRSNPRKGKKRKSTKAKRKGSKPKAKKRSGGKKKGAKKRAKKR